MLRILMTSSFIVGAAAAFAAGLPNLPAGPAPKPGATFGVTEVTGQPVADRPGFVSWKALAQVQSVQQGDTFTPKFDANLQKLDKKSVKIQGFMLPLGMGEAQDHFILTATPPTCAFCLPGGPEQVIEVKTTKPVKFSYEAVALSGKLELLKNDPMGLYYRITAAQTVD
ncbi:DUF3299 domain-containing protein [Chitinimonas sp.]|uniref:DUF3299 domain-containing protein n=1 Tax=Chitinimonas sp. TaxID=1934313 RepID=UPI0035B09C47